MREQALPQTNTNCHAQNLLQPCLHVIHSTTASSDIDYAECRDDYIDSSAALKQTLQAVSNPKLMATASFFRSPSIVFGTPITEQRTPAKRHILLDFHLTEHWAIVPTVDGYPC